MTSFEYSRWQQFYRENPWGDERADLRSGIAAAHMVAASSGRRVRVADMMPHFGVVQQRAMSEEAMKEIVKSAAAGFAAFRRQSSGTGSR